ncbi:MAG: outer membrane beta-barrel protein, partial [Thiobacillus sp.]|nr:outer membrane beta-barrel protein [Thiobacillus sp.]
EFPGIAWGSFLVYPELSLAATYDDNIYAERTHVVEDVVYTLSPSLELKSNWQQHALNVDGGADFDRYRNNGSEDVSDYWLGFDGRYDLSARTNLFGGARHARDHEDRSTPGSLITQVEPTRYDHEEAHLGLAHAFGAFRLRLGGTYDQYDYKDGALGNGATVDNDYRDHNLSSLGVRLGYELSPRYEFFGQIATDNRQYDNLIPTQVFNRDSDGTRAAAGLKFTLQPQRLAGEVFAGVMRQDYDYSGFSDLSKPYFGALAVWKPTSLTTATGFIDRSLEETTVYNTVPTTDYASGSVDTTYGFEVEHRLTSKLSVSGRAAYTRSDFQNFDRSDAIVDAGAGLRYYVIPTVYVGADLRVIDRDSDNIDAQYSRNQVMVSVGYTPARNRDYAIIPEREAGAPEAPRAQGLFSGFYLGAQLGHGDLTAATYGPRGGGGSDTADMGGFGASYALFGGWGMEINNVYLGVELDGGDSKANWYHKKDKPDSVTTYVDKDNSYGLSLRAGYLLDGGLLYGKLGMVRTDFHSYYAENQYAATGAFDQHHTENGTRFGLGLEIPASRNLFVRTDYSYTRYGSYDAPYQSGALATDITAESFDTSDAVFSLGLGWRFGGTRLEVATRPATELRGLYLGADLGHGTLGTQLTGTHDIGDTPGDFAFTGDFANSGFTGGFFAGYGHTFSQVYVGLELDAEASNFGWYHDRDTSGAGGRDFAVEKRGSYSGNLRVGYVLGNGGLLYGRVGAVRTRFNTTYNKGPNNPVDRSDKLDGTRFGLGAEIPASENAFVRMDYSYTRYNTVDILTAHTFADDMSFENSESLVRLGIGFRF